MKNIGKLLFVAILLTSALRWPVVVARAGGVGSIDCSTQKEAIAMGQCTGKCQSTFGSCFGGCPASGQNYACWDELAEYSSNGSTIYYMDTTCSYINFKAQCISNCSNEMDTCVLNCASTSGCTT